MIKEIINLSSKEFSPSPFALMNQIEADKEKSGLIFGFIHGSLIYSGDNIMCRNYKETKVFKPNTNEFLFSEFEMKQLSPDVDVVVTVEDRKSFLNYFKRLVQFNELKIKLNYFLTINSLTLETLTNEINKDSTTAIKRIMSMRPLWEFGDLTRLGNLKKTAREKVNSYDIVYQKEYDERKNFLRNNLRLNIKNFKLTADEYKTLFPFYFSLINSENLVGFPEERDKIVVPKPMGLKARKDLGSENSLFLR